MAMFIIKSDGRKEPYMVEKIKKCIQYAVQSLDVNALVLESKFDKVICDGMSTDDIQSNLIHHARVLCTPEEPDWSFVAGRLETMRRWKQCNVFERSFYYYMKEQIEDGIYKHPGLKAWTKNETNKLGKLIDHDRDLAHGYGSVLTGNKKYLMKGETLQHMHMVNAMIIASPEEKENRLEFAKEVYDALSLRKISLATPWLSNLRAHQNISSCFIIAIDDNLDSIARSWNNAAQISKFGGGLGVYLGMIRAAGATINGRADSSKGVTSWAKILNDIAVAVDQCFHPDTKITTVDGVKAISDIKAGVDRILSIDGNYDSVKKVLKGDTKEFVVINGVKVTPDHLILTIKSGKTMSDCERKYAIKSKSYEYIPACQIEPNDLMVSVRAHN